MQRRYKNSIVSILLVSLGWVLQIDLAHADAACYPSVQQCVWDSPFGNSRGVHLTLGLDDSNVLRWVANPVDDPNNIATGTITGIHQEYYYWTFNGTSGNDVMVEVPYGFPALPHGSFHLHGGFWLRSVTIKSGAGNDVLVGGDHTALLNASGSNPTGQQYESIAIIHPNSPGDGVNARLETSQPGTTLQVVGPSLAASQTHADGIDLIGPPAGTGRRAILCNLSGKPVDLMLSHQPTIDMRYGPAKSASSGFNENPNIASGCALLYVSVVYGLVNGKF